MTAQLPDGEIQQARSLVLSTEWSPWNYAVTIKTLQHLRGLCVRWLACNIFWQCLCQPIDILLAHTSASGLMVCFGEVEVWMSFFNDMTLTRSVAESDTDWPIPRPL